MYEMRLLTSPLRLAKPVLVRLRRNFHELHQITKANSKTHVWFLGARLSQQSNTDIFKYNVLV